MRTWLSSYFMAVLISGVIVALCGTAFGEQNSAVNLAVVAEPSSSYVSGDTSLEALNDEHDPASSRDRRRGSYGNWPRRGTQWVQYEWSRPVSTRKVDVYWWDDNRGVRLPKACRLLYWDGGGLVPVSSATGLGVAGDQYNTTMFDEVRTSKLRLEIDSNHTYSTGILEWKVYDSGKSPDFPPKVEADVDRVVMLGDKATVVTYEAEPWLCDIERSRF